MKKLFLLLLAVLVSPMLFAFTGDSSLVDTFIITDTLIITPENTLIPTTLDVESWLNFSTVLSGLITIVLGYVTKLFNIRIKNRDFAVTVLLAGVLAVLILVSFGVGQGLPLIVGVFGGMGFYSAILKGLFGAKVEPLPNKKQAAVDPETDAKSPKGKTKSQ